MEGLFYLLSFFSFFSFPVFFGYLVRKRMGLIIFAKLKRRKRESLSRAYPPNIQLKELKNQPSFFLVQNYSSSSCSSLLIIIM